MCKRMRPSGQNIPHYLHVLDCAVEKEFSRDLHEATDRMSEHSYLRHTTMGSMTTAAKFDTP